MQNQNLSKKQIIVVSLITLLFIVGAVGADIFLKAGAVSVPKAQTGEAQHTASPSNAPQYAKPSSKITDIVEDTPYEPGPSVLNLAYYYPEGADTSDVIHSYAGSLYTKLTQMEAQYLASFYDLTDRTPLSMAKSLGLDRSRVMGKYNPNDSTHRASDASTWTVNRFKNVNVAFYDGDGNRINGYSTVKEILSMASVYSYYHDMFDAEAMEDYAVSLWEHSHSSKISMGNVYYCSGCLNRTIEEEALEAIEEERQQQLLTDSLRKQTAVSAGDDALLVEATLPNLTETVSSGADMPTLFSEGTEALTASGTAGAGTSLSETEASETQIYTEGDAMIIGGTVSGGGIDDKVVVDEAVSFGAEETEEAESTVGVYISGSQASMLPQTEPSTTAAPTETQAGTMGGSLQTEAATTAQQSVPAATEPAASEEGPTLGGFLERGLEGALLYDGNVLVAANDQTGATLFGGNEGGASSRETTEAATAAVTLPASTAQGPGASIEAAERASQEAEREQGEQGSKTVRRTVSTCPGHIDLYVSITLKGIDDHAGLMAADPIGNGEASFNAQWQGWTEARKEEARTLNAEDWFKRYGITISAINVRNPLSEGEIDAYLSRLPKDLSPIRREIVDFALHSVGKIPYYWGGKPYGAGYERNNFGTLISPDYKGRVLRGLDCSGWINWVYWSVQGYPLKGESTGTLIGCGKRISRAELKPGDIIVRTGADAHVVMFLEWAGNGNMIAVHETGGAVNNVTVSEMTANWPYYRSLLD